MNRFLLPLFLALVCLAGCGTMQPGPPDVRRAMTSAVPDAWSPVEEELLVLINRQRALHGLAVLRADPRLHRAAVLHCREMAAHRYLGHDSPDGRDFGRRAREQGYGWQRIGENVALLVLARPEGDLARRVMFGSNRLDELAAFALQGGLPVPRTWADVGRGWSGRDWDAWQRLRRGRGGWMGSAGHRDNILLTGITDLGTGHAERSDGAGMVHHFFAAEFAVPR